jgi:hypothetical protein
VLEAASDAGGTGAAEASVRTARVTGQPGPPRFAAVSIAGLRQRKPRLSFSIIADRWGPLLRQVEVRLPQGLTLVPRASIRVDPAGRRVKYRLKLHFRIVTIRLGRAVTRLRMTLDFPDLIASRSLMRAARRRRMTLVLAGTARSAGASNLQFGVKFRPKS